MRSIRSFASANDHTPYLPPANVAVPATRTSTACPYVVVRHAPANPDFRQNVVPVSHFFAVIGQSYYVFCGLVEMLSRRGRTMCARTKTGDGRRAHGYAPLRVQPSPVHLCLLPVAGCLNTKKHSHFCECFFVLALSIFTASRPATIVDASELNFCVRDGNRWTLRPINTNFFRACTLKTEHSLLSNYLLESTLSLHL